MYLIDANVLMTAADYHYPNDVAPGFWEQILEMLNAGQACIPKSVHGELVAYKQKWLTGWVETNIAKSFILNEDQAQLQNLAQVTEWVTHGRQPEVRPHERQKFLTGADPRIIAAAMATQSVIVTYEKPVNAPDALKLKIPDVAAQFEVACIGPVEMLRSCNRQM